MLLRVLGCAGGEAEGERLTGFLIDETIAIDAGCLTQALSIPAQRAIRHVFLTHSHLDHICTLPFFAKNIFGHRAAPVILHGLPETLAVLEHHLFNGVVWPDFTRLPSADVPTLRYAPLFPHQTCQVGDLCLTPLPANHVVPTVGYLVESPTGAFLYTSDTAQAPDLYRAANACPLLKLFITEASFPNEYAALASVSKHLTPAMLASELRQLKPSIPVAVAHLAPEHKSTLLAELNALAHPDLFVLQQDTTFEM